MRKIFWENPYQTNLITHVTSVDGNQLLFEETIAYSFSGGQESDKVSVNGLPVLIQEWKVLLFIIHFQTNMDFS